MVIVLPSTMSVPVAMLKSATYVEDQSRSQLLEPHWSLVPHASPSMTADAVPGNFSTVRETTMSPRAAPHVAIRTQSERMLTIGHTEASWSERGALSKMWV